jgi:hypothetical protein
MCKQFEHFIHKSYPFKPKTSPQIIPTTTKVNTIIKVIVIVRLLHFNFYSKFQSSIQSGKTEK